MALRRVARSVFHSHCRSWSFGTMLPVLRPLSIQQGHLDKPHVGQPHQYPSLRQAALAGALLFAFVGEMKRPAMCMDSPASSSKGSGTVAGEELSPTGDGTPGHASILRTSDLRVPSMDACEYSGLCGVASVFYTVIAGDDVRLVSPGGTAGVEPPDLQLSAGDHFKLCPPEPIELQNYGASEAIIKVVSVLAAPLAGAKPTISEAHCPDCGVLATAACDVCGKRLCMSTCGTLHEGVAHCEGCEPDYGHAQEETAQEPPAKRSRKKREIKAAPGSFTIAHYPSQGAVHQSRAIALKVVGCGTKCKGHAARAVNKSGPWTFLRCRLRDSKPPCKWAALLRVMHDGTAVLWHPPRCHEDRDHNEESAQLGARGVSSLDERIQIEALLSESAAVAPKFVWRQRRLQDKALDIELKDVQGMKRVMMRERFSSTRLGQLEAAVAKHRAIPVNDCEGFFCVSDIGHDEGNKPKVTLMATTRVLLKRWAGASKSSKCCGHTDGGFKFNIMGWPVTVLMAVTVLTRIASIASVASIASICKSS